MKTFDVSLGMAAGRQISVQRQARGSGVSGWIFLIFRHAARFLLSQLYLPTVFAATLYSTDFSSFTSGDDRWVGYDNWRANVLDQGISGIGENLVNGYGKSAWLGYGKPSTNLVRIAKDVVLEGQAVLPARMKFEATIGVEGSLTGGNDLFAISFYNSNGVSLASIRFDTSLSGYGVWASDGVNEAFSGAYYSIGQLHSLSVEIDYQQNLWWVYLDGTPIYEKATFSAAAVPRQAGGISVDWEVANLSSPGDNWFLVDKVKLSAPILQLSSAVPQPDGTTAVSWMAMKAGACQVQVSSDLVTWTDLSGGQVSAATAGDSLTFKDKSTTSTEKRFYRIKQ